LLLFHTRGGVEARVGARKLENLIHNDKLTLPASSAYVANDENCEARGKKRNVVLIFAPQANRPHIDSVA
jgi:hypothetical protein